MPPTSVDAEGITHLSVTTVTVAAVALATDMTCCAPRRSLAVRRDEYGGHQCGSGDANLAHFSETRRDFWVFASLLCG